MFWTRNPRPLFPYLQELDERGYRYYFQYSLINNPRTIDPKSPPLEAAVETFQELSRQVGASRVIWRYDPIVFTEITGPDFHQENFAHLSQTLQGCTRRSVISLMDIYAKAHKRLKQLGEQGAPVYQGDLQAEPWFPGFVRGLVQTADQNKIEITSCAEPVDMQPYGVRPGKCIDDDWIRQVFGLGVTHQKDPSQWAACGCVQSRDIGMYDSCLYGCTYCYATTSFEKARSRYDSHDPGSPSMI